MQRRRVPKLTLLVQEEATPEPVKKVLRLIDSRHGVTGPIAPGSEHADLDWKLMRPN